ncbi:MAG TPA: hypothetical protein VHY20_09895, partial [Pirellulales bacterium]|nr:hypothetical protein [Pirellulales bacterium]
HVVAGGSFVEAGVGFAGVVLAVLGLVHVAPGYMASIATLAIGAALAFEGAALRGRSSNWTMPAEFTAGMAGVVLGILAILGIEPGILVPVAVIVFSAGLLLGTGAHLQFGAEGTLATSGSHVLCGLAGVILGIMALVGTATLTLSLVALLTLGLSTMCCGTLLGEHMAGIWRR